MFCVRKLMLMDEELARRELTALPGGEVEAGAAGETRPSLTGEGEGEARR